MWELLAISAALAVGAYTFAKIFMNLAKERSAKCNQSRTAAAHRWRLEQAEATKRNTARDMQIAIQQLAQSADFRRAASFAAAAVQAGVPADFRIRQFRRLRPLMIEHLARRLQAGATLETASTGLRELISGLGAAGYEADYIASDAQDRQRATNRHAPNYRDRLRQLHADHAARQQAIRDTPDLDDELREQLLEAEQERFRDEILEEPDQDE